ncbi:DUF4145 domain-containing protein [Pelagicoccus mobilis]|uniref:DUF4145 domain-containing protein n=1 Tax=Pelagicoccus mobilis TaxID=415221 RepID=A0A934VQN2_9BACT|nr:DUF4145 domain-containing protein [Pelagicoccus mobilis]MBK1877085.1 DUF4145 domain-containing protein [Pelagicoccus mobilis]
MKTICLHCSSDKGFEYILSREYKSRSYSANLKDYDGEEFEGSMAVVACKNCGALTVYDDTCGWHEDDDICPGEILFPSIIHDHGAIPKKVKEAYEKALRVQWIDPDAFAVLIRKALELVCSLEGAKGHNLQKKLENLKGIKSIPSDIAEAAQALRLSGNIAAHDVEKGLHPLYVHKVDDFFKLILDYIYILPFRIEHFKTYQKLAQQNGGHNSGSSAASIVTP